MAVVGRDHCRAICGQKKAAETGMRYEACVLTAACWTAKALSSSILAALVRGLLVIFTPSMSIASSS